MWEHFVWAEVDNLIKFNGTDAFEVEDFLSGCSDLFIVIWHLLFLNGKICYFCKFIDSILDLNNKFFIWFKEFKIIEIYSNTIF